LTLNRLARIAVAIALTGYVLWKSDPARVIDVSARADLRWIGLACALVVVDRVLMAYRWWMLLCAIDDSRRPPARVVLRIFFVSTFVGTFLPSIGGDLYRAYSLARQDVSGAQAAASVLMDRLLGVLSLMVMAIVGLFLVKRLMGDRLLIVALAAAAVVCAIAVAAIFSERVASFCRAIAESIPIGRVQRIGADLISAVRSYGRSHRELSIVLVVSIAVQILRIGQAFCLGRAIGIALPPTTYFALVPAILLIMLLPITVSGLGTGQLAFVWLFGEVGVAQPDAFALSVLFIALGIVGNLPGALLYVTGDSSRTIEPSMRRH
jgi:glycosyltransferase 2 family protein